MTSEQKQKFRSEVIHVMCTEGRTADKAEIANEVGAILASICVLERVPLRVFLEYMADNYEAAEKAFAAQPLLWSSTIAEA